VKRSLLFWSHRTILIASGTLLIAAAYGLVRLAFGLLLPDVTADLGLTVGAAGLTSSAGSVLYVVGALAGFLLAPRVPRILVAVAAATAGGGAVGMAVAPDAALFSAAAVVGAAGAGVASPAMVELVNRAVGADRRARMQSVVNSGTGPGLVIASILALLLLPDWRAVWLIAGGFTLVVAVIVLRAAPARAARPGVRALPPRRWFAGHAVILVGALLLGAASAAVWNFGRTLLVESGVRDGAAVVAWIALGAGATLVAATAGALARLGARAAWALSATTMGLATAGFVLAPAHPLLAWSTAALFGWGYTAATGSLIAWTAEVDPDRAASGTALLFVTLVLGQAIGAAALGGTIAATGFPAPFLVAAATALVAAACAAPGSRLSARRGRTLEP
jgi:predicted MFS family arabinose efflux permease